MADRVVLDVDMVLLLLLKVSMLIDYEKSRRTIVKQEVRTGPTLTNMCVTAALDDPESRGAGPGRLGLSGRVDGDDDTTRDGKQTLRNRSTSLVNCMVS